jgi:DNA-directed RNA polymerase
LVNREKPGDVYTKVLHIVLEKMVNETNPSDIKFAKLLIEANCVNRKVVKQTVMTSVYGVTLIGARDQIKKQLAEKKLFDANELFFISMYLAKKTIESIGDLFSEANEIKAWLTKSALVISHSGNCVKWITPMGLPCVQPYKKLTKTEVIRTHSQGIMIMSDFEDQPVNARKHGTAFPPNYIHSLDSTHMMMSCRKAIENDINFSSVHDSYWCHPSDIEQLNKILREEFVNLYNQPLLENLARGFSESFPELKFPEIPDRGNLDLSSVLDSTYFFS